MEPQVNPRKGMSILEVLVALIILAIVLPGLAGMVISSRKAQNSNIHMDQAYAYGQLLMDSLTLTPGFSLWKPNTDSTKTSSTTIAGMTYNSTIVMKSTGIATIQIAWTQGGAAHSIQLKEVLSNTGLYR